MTTRQIRETLTDVSQAVDVPVVDQVSFRARVRSAQRRRTTSRVLVAGAAAAAVLAGTAALLQGSRGDDRVVQPADPSRTVAAQGLSETVWFVRDGELTALDPSGGLHPLGIDVESVVGWTTEHVYAVDDESRLVVVEHWVDDAGRLHDRREEPPVTEPLESVALSGDGRFVAWLTDGKVTVRDNKADRDQTFAADPDSYVAAVGADGVLLSEGGDLVLRSGQHLVDVPTVGGGDGWAAQVAGGLVLVPDPDGRSRLYDVSQGEARLTETIVGSGVLGPYGERVAVLPTDPDSGGGLEVWDGGETRPVTGLGATVDAVRWADETTLLVSGREGARGVLYSCDLDLRCAPLPVDGEVSLVR